MFGFILALIGGFFVPQLEGPIGRPVAKTLSKFFRIESEEIRLVSYSVVLVLVGVLCAIFHTGSPLGIAFGAMIGYFLPRIIASVKKSN